MKDLVIGVVMVIIIFSVFLFGQKTKQTEIESRAKKIEKECYTNQDIEYILFKNSQL